MACARDGRMPVKRLLLHAPNVHQGGGKALLASLLQSLGNDLDCILLADARLDIPPLAANVRVISFPPSIAGRLDTERAKRVLDWGRALWGKGPFWTRI